MGCAVLLAGAVLLCLRAYARSVDRRIAAYQDGLMANHVVEVQNIYTEIRGWRHDFHSHIQTMKACRALGRDEELDDYLSRLDEDLKSVDVLLRTGNVMVDAILNSKFSLARARGIAVDAAATVPEALTVSQIDLCVLLGNLLDNAMEACSRQGEGERRFLRVYIAARREQLYLSITNTSGGIIKKREGRYLSDKPGVHGLGLLRVDRLVDKYGGYLKRSDEEGAFTTEILLPL